MSWFSSAPKEEPPSFDAFEKTRNKNVDAAIFEIQGTAKLFNFMTTSCNDKCITKFKTSELQLGESTCIDRCVVKYMHTSTKVGEVLQKQAQVQAQFQAQQQ